MSWTGGRRKGWIPRNTPIDERARVPQPTHSPPPIAAPVHPGPVCVPNYPAFSPAAVAMVVRVGRSTVGYWLTAGKLDHYRDCLGEPYVLREELVRFIKDYLERAVVDAK